ncbi:MAG: efflux RND transporter permease subunit [Planctomycetia bacterium]|nr:efflux RND transporter permease subunit [Planctomycetia bacterium]
MLARFFIDRPIFAWVISIVIVLAGIVSVVLLPIAQYPDITPPTVQVTCNYAGANAVVVQDTVAAPIEQQVIGVEGMLYMSSQCSNDGTYSLNVTFQLGTDLNMAQVLVQNRVAQALPKLPDVVQATGVTTKKRSPAILLVVNLFSELDPETNDYFYDQLYLSNYATIQVRDQLAALDGVGDVGLLGQQDYSMRVWVDPNKLAARNMTAGDVVAALQEQNVQVAAGQIGQPPVPRGQDFQYTMTTLGRLEQAEQFENIILKTGQMGEVTLLKDVARVELGAQNLNTRSRLDGKPSAGVAIYQLPGSNALDTADRVKRKMHELRQRFPQGLKYAIVYDTTPFIKESVLEVFKTLFEAVLLVALVVLFFLQDWKAVILPLIDVGVSLVGTFAVMLVMGFSLNNLSLFGLVLAIGIVVDDAIVVLENIERWLAKGLPVREATIGAMTEITGPIIAITLVLCSVFLPSALLGGITGQFYRQFALTIAASMLISAINAMTLTPARAAAIFGHREQTEHGQHARHEALPWWAVVILGGILSAWLLSLPFRGFFQAAEGEQPLGMDAAQVRMALYSWGLWLALFVPGAVAGWFFPPVVNRVLGRFFAAFNRWFDRMTVLYGKLVARLLRGSLIALAIYVLLIGLTVLGFIRLPTGFIPAQDKGYLVVDFQLPDSAALERTIEVTARIEKICAETPGVAHTIGVPGTSFVQNANSSNYGGMFIVLKSFEERHGHADQYYEAVLAKLRRRFYEEVPEARVAVFGPPAVDGLGNAGGFKLMLQDRGDLGLVMLQGQADNLAEKGNQVPGLVGLFNSFRAQTPQLYVDIDRTQCKTMQVALSDVFNTLQVYLGGFYVNDFNRFGRTWQVNVQADSGFRISADQVRNLKVRNAAGEMVPLGALLTVKDSSGPVSITRYNTFPAAAINGATQPGVSTGTAVQQMDALAARELPRGFATEWTELTYLQILSSRTESFRDLMQNPLTAFFGAVVLVFLILAALYESWTQPLAIILVVPMCVLSALVGVWLARLDIDIFVQVGFIVLVGLAAKNAILVVDFARAREEEGKSTYDAILIAAHDRLRPIIMTSIAFILGVLPLVLASGAGAEMRFTLGVAVFSGMIGVTIFGIFLTPVFYYVVRLYLDRAPAIPVPLPPSDETPVAAAPSDAIQTTQPLPRPEPPH